MNYIGWASAVMAMAVLAGFAAADASATTLEVEKGKQNTSVELTASLQSGTILLLKDTAGFSKGECSTSHIAAATSSPFTGFSVTGPSSALSLTKCHRPITVHNPGKVEITYTTGTNGTVASEEAVVTVASVIGTLICETGGTTNIGTLTGAAAGSATIDLNAVINCGLIPSAKLEGIYTITSPNGLGVSS